MLTPRATTERSRRRSVVGTVRWKPYQERWLTKALLTAPLREVAPRLQTSLCLCLSSCNLDYT
ncbi:hypothetical protein QUB80_03860 [Chlorogloeopsis sp. ULAP01]|uniref:hypothetical protein n=1 Tax=Chlorogloeopsis sp. ULAP01 TaxID=3056483 RepID=UPI0025AA98D6|nr:hypothetical protein [Chlorogloeopsis sp. ULAP01]MDM9379832.1 hypothetical protein [Chlorogloeopsis sp. ULAP01]